MNDEKQESKACIKCNKFIKSAAKKCPACGELLFRTKPLLIVFGIFFLALFLITGTSSEETIHITQEKKKPTTRTVQSCPVGTSSDAKYYIKTQETPFYLSPDKSKGMVVNAKASRILKQTEYQTLWPTMVLQGLCETPEWLQAKIVEVDGRPVEWETGWVEKDKVLSQPSGDYSAGLIWQVEEEPSFSEEEKRLIREGALRALQDEKNCRKITGGYKSNDKEDKYFVTCLSKNSEDYFNIWFSLNDVRSGKKITAPIPFDEDKSRELCIDEIKRRVTHPSTLDIYFLTGYATSTAPNGNRETIQIFSTKNSFGLELKHRARCLITTDGGLDITITEEY